MVKNSWQPDLNCFMAVAPLFMPVTKFMISSSSETTEGVGHKKKSNSNVIHRCFGMAATQLYHKKIAHLQKLRMGLTIFVCVWKVSGTEEWWFSALHPSCSKEEIRTDYSTIFSFSVEHLASTWERDQTVSSFQFFLYRQVSVRTGKCQFIRL